MVALSSPVKGFYTGSVSVGLFDWFFQCAYTDMIINGTPTTAPITVKLSIIPTIAITVRE